MVHTVKSNVYTHRPTARKGRLISYRVDWTGTCLVTSQLTDLWYEVLEGLHDARALSLLVVRETAGDDDDRG